MGRPKGSKNKISSKIKHICNVCNNIFETIHSRKEAKFCSYKCYWTSMQGKEGFFKGQCHTKESKIKIGKNTPKRFGEKNHAWKGGRTIAKCGYVLIRSTKHPFKNRMGYVQEHRLVMENHLGRYLKKEEHVHHINENKLDNRIENLQIVSNSDHGKIHLENRLKNEKGQFI